jgi:hypothetical protein
MPPRSQAPITKTPFHDYRFDDGTIWTEFYRSDEGYVLRFPGFADFEISMDGTKVRAYPTGNCDETTAEHLFINQVVPLALSRQGRPAFHASVVVIDRGAVAFLGRTGMGKSTLAASFALDESSFLTDDALIVEKRGDAFFALPGHASVRLWDDSVTALAGDEIPRADALSYTDKNRLLAGDVLASCSEPRPLLAAYVLRNNRIANVQIEPLEGSRRTMKWVENSFLLDIEDQDLLARHFDWTYRISSAVPSFALDYPRDYGMLAEVRKAIGRHVLTL